MKESLEDRLTVILADKMGATPIMLVLWGKQKNLVRKPANTTFFGVFLFYN